MAIYNTIRPTIVQHVAAACGSGKTHGFIELVAEQRKDQRSQQNFAYVGPTMEKLAEVEAEFKTRGIMAKRIDSSTHEGCVIPEIVDWLRSTNHDGRVLLIAQESYFRLPYFHGRECWDVVIDEVPQTDRFYNPRLPRSWRLLEEHLDIGPVINRRLGQLVAKNEGRLRKHLELPRDDCEEAAREILADVANPNRLVYVDLQSWEKMTERQDVSLTDDEANRIYFVSMLSPEAFRGTTIMGADVKKSMLWAWLEKNGVKWVENKAITERLRYREYPESVQRRLHIVHALNDGAWSKYQRRKLERHGVDIDTSIANHIDGKFLLVQNNDRDGKSCLEKLPGFQRLSSACHGLNVYQDYTRIVFTSALNRDRTHARMLRNLGLSDQVQRDSTVQSSLHQSVMRTALRNPESTAHVEAIVPDRWMADALVEAIGGAYVCDSDHDFEERFRVPALTNDIEQWGAVGDEDASSCKRNAKTHDVKNIYVDDFGVALSTIDATPPHSSKSLVALTLHRLADGHDGEPYATGFDEQQMSVLKLVGFLQDAHGRVRETKKGDRLFQLSQFDLNAPRRAGLLRKENFVSSSGLVLDFDGGTVSPAEFTRIFWKEAGSRTKHAFAIFNTFSTSPQERNKFRVVMPFNGRAESVAEYEAIFDAIEQRLADNGHSPYTSGLDRASRNPVQSYWLPCANVAHPGSAFFEMRGLRRTDEFERYAIKPGRYAQFTAPPEQKRWMTSPDHDKTDQQQYALAQAEEMKAEIEEMTQDRRKPVFKLVGKLLAAGEHLGEIHWELSDWAPDATVERHVDGAIKQWERYQQNGSWSNSSDEELRLDEDTAEDRLLRRQLLIAGLVDDDDPEDHLPLKPTPKFRLGQLSSEAHLPSAPRTQ